MLRQLLQAFNQQRRKFSAGGGEIDDGGRNRSTTNNDIGPKNRQVVARIWEQDAVEDVEIAPYLSSLQVNLANTWATQQLVADCHGIAL